MSGNKLRRVAVVGVAVMTVAHSAAPAEAAIGSMSARLVLKGKPALSGPAELYIDGLVAMTQTEAQGLINSGHKVVVRIWGDDPTSDDLLLGPYYLIPMNPAAIQTGYIVATPQGLKFYKFARATASLNEDYAPYAHGDEIYAGVRLVNSDGTTIRLRETNRWTGYCDSTGCGSDDPFH